MDNVRLTESKKVAPSALGARLRHARLRHDPPLTLKQLAGGQLSTAMVSRLERGDVLPSLDTLAYLAERLGVSVASLLDPAGQDHAAGAAASARGRALLRLGRPDAALEELDKAVVVEPGGDAAFDRVEALVALGRAKEAAIAAAALPPDDPRTDRAVGLALLAQGQPIPAVAALRLAAAHLQPPGEGDRRDRSPGVRIASAETLLALGRALEASGSRETAAITLRQAVRHLEGLTTTKDYGFEVLTRTDGTDTHLEAAAALAGAAWAASLDTRIRGELARVEVLLGRHRDALETLGPILAATPLGARSPDVEPVLRDLAVSNRAGARQAPVASPLVQAAAAYERHGNLAEADQAIRRAALAERAERRPARAAALLIEAAMMWLRAGDRERAAGLLVETQTVLETIG